MKELEHSVLPQMLHHIENERLEPDVFCERGIQKHLGLKRETDDAIMIILQL